MDHKNKLSMLDEILVFHDSGSNDSGQGSTDNNDQASGNDDSNNSNSGQGNQSNGNITMDDLQKQVQGLESMIGKWGNEIKEVRDMKGQFDSFKQQFSQYASNSKAGNQNNSNMQSEQPPKLSLEDEQNLNEKWKSFPAEKREQMINEAQGATRSDKIQNVRTELARLYVEEGTPIPDELFSNGNSQSASNRAVSTLSTLGREMLGLVENRNQQNVPPGSRPSGANANRAVSQPTSKRGKTSGGLAGLTENK